MLLRTLAILALVIASLGHAIAQGSCDLRPVVQLPSPPNPLARPLVPATIEGQPTHLMIDTGAAWSVIDKALAERIRLNITYLPRGGGLVDFSGNPIDGYVRVQSFKLGAATVAPGSYFFVGRLTGQRDEETIGGLLGLSILKHYDLEIDSERNTVTLFLPAKGDGCGAYWADEEVSIPISFSQPDRRFGPLFMGSGNTLATVAVNGKEVNALIDTGAPWTVIDRDFASYLGVELEAGKADAGTVSTLSLGGLTFHNISVRIFDMQRHKVIVGMHELSKLHLYFAFPERTLYMTPADARGAETPSVR